MQFLEIIHILLISGFLQTVFFFIKISGEKVNI